MSGQPVAPLQWTDELLASFWGYYAHNRQEDYFTSLFGGRILDLTRRFYGKDAVVCDYGCGSGHLLEQLLQTHRSAGCDFSSDNLTAVRARLGDHSNLAGLFLVGDKPVEMQFDVLYVVETVEHVLERHEETFFRNLSALVRPGGVLIATTPHAEDLEAGTVFCPSCRHTFHRWQHVKSFDGPALVHFLGRAGFDPTAVFTTDFSARSQWQRAKALLRPMLGKRNPHLVYAGRKRS